jgi:putative serine protease PepD
MKGQVVGINSAIATLGSGFGGQTSGSIGLGFAIPIDTARPIAEQLLKDGVAKHALLGVSASDAVDQSGNAVGARLQEITQGGAAAAAGLQPGDVITKFGDRAVDGADALVAAVRSEQPGAKVTVEFQRNGQSRKVDVTLGSEAGTG